MQQILFQRGVNLAGTMVSRQNLKKKCHEVFMMPNYCLFDDDAEEFPFSDSLALSFSDSLALSLTASAFGPALESAALSAGLPSSPPSAAASAPSAPSAPASAP